MKQVILRNPQDLYFALQEMDPHSTWPLKVPEPESYPCTLVWDTHRSHCQGADELSVTHTFVYPIA